jgi:hypothetical protein
VINEGRAAEIDDLLYIVGQSMKDFFVDRGAEVVSGKAMLDGDDVVVAVRVLTTLTGALLKRVGAETRKEVTLAFIAKRDEILASFEDKPKTKH